jgi:hypothetical protein
MGAWHQDRLADWPTDRLTVGRNITLSLLVQLAVGDSRGKKSAGEDLTCDLKSTFVALTSAVWLGAFSELWRLVEYRLVQSDWRSVKRTSEEWFEVIVSGLLPVAWRRIVDTENPSVCATVKCTVCRIAIGLWLSLIKRDCNRSAHKIQSSELEPAISSRVSPYTSQYITMQDLRFSWQILRLVGYVVR